MHHFRHRSSRSSGLDLKECLRVNNGKFIQKWYDEISSMLEDEAVRDNFMKNSEQDDLTKLRRMNDNIGFFVGGSMIPRDQL